MKFDPVTVIIRPPLRFKRRTTTTNEMYLTYSKQTTVQSVVAVSVVQWIGRYGWYVTT